MASSGVLSGSLVKDLNTVRRVINNVATHLKNYLPLANAHMTDFIVSDHWNKFLTDPMRNDLLKLTEAELISLPSGSQFVDDFSLSEWMSKRGCSDKLEQSSSFVVCGDSKIVLSGKSAEWDKDVLPNWTYDCLKDFIHGCLANSLPYCGILRQTQDIHGMENLVDVVPVVEFMSAKKSHEVEIMTELCASLASRRNVNHAIEIGSGKGYLGSHLCLKHGMRVLGIDSSSSNTAGAAGRSERLGKQWSGLVKRSADHHSGDRIKIGRRRRKKKDSVDPISGTAQENLSGSAEVKTETNLGAFVPVTQFVDKNTDLSLMIHQHLHSHHDQRATDSVVSVTEACSENSDISSDFPAAATDDSSRSNQPGLCCDVSGRPCAVPYMIAGLHACGDLTSNILRLFLANDDTEILCSVGCCYHHLTEAFVCCPFDKDKDTPHDECGFPMSGYLLDRGCQLGRNARMVASQAPDRIAQSGSLPTQSLFWRALLQVILRDVTGEVRNDWHVGRIAAKCPDFVTYCVKALAKLGMDHRLSAEDLHHYEERYDEYRAYIQCFVQVKAALAPCVEALIQLDRLCYLLEQDCVEEAFVLQAFDPLTSPRCYALVATKCS